MTIVVEPLPVGAWARLGWRLRRLEGASGWR